MSKNADPTVSSKASHIDSAIVFAHSTISSLASYLVSLASQSDGVSTSDNTVEQHVQEMNALVKRYTANLPNASFAHLPKAPLERETVLITGTTGALGGFMLSRMLEDSKVERIWAVNRGSKGGKSLFERQHESFVDKGIDPTNLKTNTESGRVRFIEADLSADRLGLDEELYNEV